MYKIEHRYQDGTTITRPEEYQELKWASRVAEDLSKDAICNGTVKVLDANGNVLCTFINGSLQ